MSDKKRKALTARAVIFVLFGNLLIGLAVGLFRVSAFGVDPCTSLNMGIGAVLGLKYIGTLQLFTNLIMLSFVFCFRRDLIGFGTLINMVCIGYLADFTVYGMSFIFPETTLLIRIICMILAIPMICFGCALYFVPDQGLSPYDALGYVAEKLCHGKVPFKWTRVAIDISCVAAAAVLGLMTGELSSMIGIGTIIMMFFTGPLIQFFLDRFVIGWYQKEKEPDGECEMELA